MKKYNVFILTIIMATLISCGANPTKIMSKVLDKVYIGMPLQEFKQQIEKEELIEANSQVSIYRLVIKTYNDAHVALSGNGWRQDHRYFYFVEGKLNRIDKGERAVDYRIKVD